MGYSVLKAELQMFAEGKGGRKGSVKSGYSPNHKFDDENLYFGLIEFCDDEWHHPGETNEVKIKLLDSKDCEDRLEPGFEWEVTEGAQVVGKAKLLSVEGYVETEE